MDKVKLVVFDLDDTLIRNIDSVMLPCILNGKEKEHLAIMSREKAGELDWIAADTLSAGLFKGLAESKLTDSFLDVTKPLDNIQNVVDSLHETGILCIVITVGPKQVAKAACNIWGFDDCYGSDYEVIDGMFTGKVCAFNYPEDKTNCLIDFCGKHNIAPENCVAIGDGVTDIPIFEYCGKSIAINALPDVQKKAMHSIDTQDLADIMRFII